MFKIKEDDYDELCKVMIDLTIITYLQRLAYWDKDVAEGFTDGLGAALKSLPDFLWELQFENVEKLNRMLCEESVFE